MIGLSRYEPEDCNLLVSMMEKGLGYATFCLEKRISETTFFKWLHTHPAFKEAYAVGRIAKKAFMDEQILYAIDDRDKNLNAIMALDRDGRPLLGNGFEALKTPSEKFDFIENQVSQGYLTLKEAKAWADFLRVGVDIHESTDILKRLEALEAGAVYESSKPEGTDSEDTPQDCSENGCPI